MQIARATGLYKASASNFSIAIFEPSRPWNRIQWLPSTFAMVWLQQLRIKEWVKNLFIFLPVFFAGRLGEPALLKLLCIEFAAFSLIASGIYCINDLADINYDRMHPAKRKRPLANGLLSKPQVICAAFFCLLVGTALAIWLLPVAAQFTLLFYLLLQLAYTFAIKHISVIDCVAIALGFVCRIVLGGAVMETVGSSWIILLTFLLASYLAFAKRRCELALLGTGSRRSLQHYSLPFLDAALIVSCAITIVAYILYTQDEEVLARVRFQYFYIGGLFVMVGLLRHLQQTIQKSGTESPTDFLLKDPLTIINILLWGLFNFLVLYGSFSGRL